MRQTVLETVKTIMNKVTGNEMKTTRFLDTWSDLEDFDCYEPVTREFSKHCFSLSKVKKNPTYMFRNI